MQESLDSKIDQYVGQSEYESRVYQLPHQPVLSCLELNH